MNLSRHIMIVFCTAVFVAQADIVWVNVPAQMLHPPAPNIGYVGKVTYAIQAGDNDSIFVTLEIIPLGGGTPLQLTDVVGDVGLIRIVNPRVAETKEIFFRYVGDPGAKQYVARIRAVAAKSAVAQYVESKLASLSFNDRVNLLYGYGYNTGSAPGVPPMYTADGPHGVRDGNATLFPTNTCLASTFDTSLAREEGVAKGKEFRAKGKNVYLAPAQNLIYHPQQGRGFEYYSEDPYLTGIMAKVDAQAVQTMGVAATCKHYCANQKEENRNTSNSKVDERSLRELYIKAFEPALKDGGALCVMTAYNRINGSFGASNKYTLTDVLRNEWGFKGIAMTDWGGYVDNFEQAARYGVDLRMPWQEDYTAANFQRLGASTDSIVNMKARRILYVEKTIGALEPGYQVAAFKTALMSAEHRALSRKIGTRGIILGRNDGNILPLPLKGAKIALTGPYADVCRKGGRGASEVEPVICISPRAGIVNTLSAVGAGASTIVTNINEADYVIVFVGVEGETEGHDRPGLGLTNGDADVATALAAKPQRTIVVYTGGSACTEGNWSKAPVIVFALYPGQEQGYCIADVLFGNYNPSGKLPFTFPKNASQVPNFTLVFNELQYPRADTAHGYFRVNKMRQEPLFPFGHGLTYTTFEYSNLFIYPQSIIAGDRVFIQIDVKNTGQRSGEEAVQLYLSLPRDRGVPVREQELRGFQKVSLEPGETKRLLFSLRFEDMAYFDTGGQDFSGRGSWKMLSGVYGVRVGTSSQTDRQPTVSGSFTVQ